jgi:hypothetical protein
MQHWIPHSIQRTPSGWLRMEHAQLLPCLDNAAHAVLLPAMMLSPAGNAPKTAASAGWSSDTSFCNSVSGSAQGRARARSRCRGGTTPTTRYGSRGTPRSDGALQSCSTSCGRMAHLGWTEDEVQRFLGSLRSAYATACAVPLSCKRPQQRLGTSCAAAHRPQHACRA